MESPFIRPRIGIVVPNLLNWDQIRGEFNDTLLLGNGASIAVHREFDYSSLFETAQMNSFFIESIPVIFDFYQTKDFELVLSHLWHTSIINRFLGVHETETEQAYENTRDALIRSIRAVHARYEHVVPYLQIMSNFMKNFKKVINLNYDLLVYWAMMKANDGLGNWFKDCFLHGIFQDECGWLERPDEGVVGATLVFYPHGSLFLATDKLGNETKLARDSEYERLLDIAIENWESADYIPLFVSEGESEQKLDAIKRSAYLQNVYYSVLPDCGNSILIYGWSLSNNDKHIIEKIAERNILRIGVSINVRDRSEEDIESKVEEKRNYLRRLFPSAQIYFLNAQSSGCWIY